MKDDELLGYLKKDHGIAGYQNLTADVDYVCPAEAWFFDEFAMALRQMFAQLDIGLWASEDNDCDDFARGAAWFAQVLHHRTGEKKSTALAVGEFWYQRGGFENSGHAINIAVIKTGENQYKPVFMEPQTQQQIYLTQREILSCTVLRF